MKRLKDAISKLFFCFSVSHNRFTFLKLIRNTKQFSFYKKNHSYASNPSELPVAYQFHIGNKTKDVYLRTAAGDIAVFYEIFWLQVYKLANLNYTDFKVIVDVGANIGLATLFFQSLSPDAVLYAIEPDEENFELLQKNLAPSISHQKVKPIQAAVANTDGNLQLNRFGLAYNSKVDALERGQTVTALSFNTFIQQYAIDTIDLMKIDVEGFEHHIFKTNTEWLDKVTNIIIEIHSKTDYETCIEAITKKNFCIKKLKPVSAGIENIFWAYRLN